MRPTSLFAQRSGQEMRRLSRRFLPFHRVRSLNREDRLRDWSRFRALTSCGVRGRREGRERPHSPVHDHDLHTLRASEKNPLEKSPSATARDGKGSWLCGECKLSRRNCHVRIGFTAREFHDPRLATAWHEERISPGCPFLDPSLGKQRRDKGLGKDGRIHRARLKFPAHQGKYKNGKARTSPFLLPDADHLHLRSVIRSV